VYYDLVNAQKEYLEKAQMQQPIYKRIKVDDIIAFPFTYKLAVDTEHGHVPMAGSASLVDVNQDGKFDKNDYVKLQSRPSLNEYFYNLLSEKFKQSLQNAVKDIY
jgi:hypothetical protein